MPDEEGMKVLGELIERIAWLIERDWRPVVHWLRHPLSKGKRRG